jgi:hypothetical protein
VLLSRLWGNLSDPLIIVKPATVIAWHRTGFRRYWTWRSRHKGGRPGIDPKVRALIKRMATANMWGAPRIHRKLLKLGDCPAPRGVEPLSMGNVVEIPVVGGLHRCYTRLTA